MVEYIGSLLVAGVCTRSDNESTTTLWEEYKKINLFKATMFLKMYPISRVIRLDARGILQKERKKD